jgi:hypothetical protein
MRQVESRVQSLEAKRLYSKVRAIGEFFRLVPAFPQIAECVSPVSLTFWHDGFERGRNIFQRSSM